MSYQELISIYERGFLVRRKNGVYPDHLQANNIVCDRCGEVNPLTLLRLLNENGTLDRNLCLQCCARIEWCLLNEIGVGDKNQQQQQQQTFQSLLTSNMSSTLPLPNLSSTFSAGGNNTGSSTLLPPFTWNSSGSSNNNNNSWSSFKTS